MNRSLQLGAFHLGECIGVGGMGKVYRAVHHHTGVAAAAKIIFQTWHDKSSEQFHREVQAQAGLAHPGVVYLFDYGTVDADTVSALDDEAGGERPYVVMELAEEGSLREYLPVRTWDTVRHLLIQVLDVLAAAHARGVIHRDLKPENFLLFDTGEDGLRIKLADFGIAHPVHSESDRDTVSLNMRSGTLNYMPPEQFRARWRQYGPWTDLYAVGCIAWELICGRPPFRADNPVAMSMEHAEADRPALAPQFPVPEEVEAWIHRAMAIRPEERFQRAADAAWALPPELADATAQLEPVGDADTVDAAQAPTVGLAPTIVATEMDSQATGETALEYAETAQYSATSVAPGDGEWSAPHSVQLEHPPLPEHWRREIQTRRTTPLVGTGLGLFGLREIPFVDRDDERDRIWHALREVIEEDRLRVVLLAGGPGIGKSCLARWMMIRAHEVGAGELMRAVHTSAAAKTQTGLGGMVQSLFRAWKLSRRDLYDHLFGRLPPLDDEDGFRRTDARALTELIAPAGDGGGDEGPGYQFDSPRQKSALLTRVLKRMGRRRAPVVWLDDLQWGTKTLDWVEFMCERPEPAPRGLIVATLRDDILTDDEDMARRIETLREHPVCDWIDVEPLKLDDHREFIERLLPLESEVAISLAGRTEGNPLLAYQLLGDWVARDRLEVGERGFGVGGDEPLLVPDDIHEVWTERLNLLVGRYPPARARQVREAIEIAAALGREVDGQEWKATCQDANLRVPAGLVDGLIERGLAERTDEGWAFAHGLLVDSVRRLAREAGRWKRHHRRCARMLETHHRDRLRQTAYRRAEHWIEAGRPEAALEPLAVEFKRLREMGEATRCEQIRRQREQILDQVDADASDPRRLENELFAAYYQSFIGETGNVIKKLDVVISRAEKYGDWRNLSQAHGMMGVVRVRQSHHDDVLHHFETAVELAEKIQDRALLARLERNLGWAHRMAGRADKAEQHLKRSRDLAREQGNDYQALAARASLAIGKFTRGQLGPARKMLEEIVEQTRERGYRSIEQTCLSSLGDLAMGRSDYETARNYHERAHQLSREMGGAESMALNRLNLAQVELHDGNFDAARNRLESGARMFDEMDSGEWEELRHCIRLALACGMGRWEESDRLLKRYCDGWPDGAYGVVDHPRLLELAARFATEANDTDKASKLLGLALQLWQKLGDDEAIARVQKELDSQSNDGLP